MNRIIRRSWLFLLAVPVLAACGGGSAGDPGRFQLLQFLESGRDSIPRNRVLTFSFSAPVGMAQDLPERLKIENVQGGAGQSNFSKAIGEYFVVGEQVVFTPRLPEKPDRSDAGLRANGSYHVFVKSGPDALVSASGERISTPQEFLFDTSIYFEDPIPAQPPRVVNAVARDVTDGSTTDISRTSTGPTDLALMDSNSLIAGGRIIEPGAGGATNSYSTPWNFDVYVSEALDPSTINTDTVKLYEIRDDALTTATTATAGWLGMSVQYAVPIKVSVSQRPTPEGALEYIIRVAPIQTLVDDARYRLSLSGNILGIDFRKVFIGDNGLTGDGVSTSEPGGLGYTTEFLVYDRAAISASRTLTYDPLVDGIHPEAGQTTLDPALYNSALYNPLTSPSTAVGFLSAFGTGKDGDLAVAGGTTTTIDTGDTPNAPLGNPFTVSDLNPNDEYIADTRPGGPLTYDTPTPFTLELKTLTVSSSSTLKFIGMNPVILRVSGIVQIAGIVDASGAAGAAAGGAAAAGGIPGAGGFPGGNSTGGVNTCSYYSSSCTDFTTYLNNCAAAKTAFPFSTNGYGPGRGLAGGDQYADYYSDSKNTLGSSGGGGGSHATMGTAGEDLKNSAGAPGTPGPACSLFVNVRLAGVIGVRGQPGPTYGDPEAAYVLLGGSGGGPAGAVSVYSSGNQNMAGGAGGGGGGSFTVIAAGDIVANGGLVQTNGGNGGAGRIKSYTQSFAWDAVSGGGGGGAGGLISLISGADIKLSGAILSALGGVGGPAAVPTAGTCTACNRGGDGGKGYIFLMDADGSITGFPQGIGDYPNYANGYLKVSAFDASRFSSISAITELFPMSAANPAYQPMLPADLFGVVSTGQTIDISCSSAKSNPDNPLFPDPSTEIMPIPIATLSSSPTGLVVTLTGDMSALNMGGMPDRDAYVRVIAVFHYTVGVEAALGPFASIDRVTIRYSFNG